MKRLIAASMMALVFAAGVADAKSRGGSSSRSFSRPSVSKPVSRPAAPKLNLSKPAAPAAKPKAFVSSKPSGTTIVKQAPAKRTVVSTPSRTRVVKSAPARKVVSPVQYKKTVIVKRTVYRPSYNRGYGYNRNYYGNRYYGGGYGYNNYGGYNSGSGFGSSLMGGVLGAMAGMYLYDALTDEECAKDAAGQCLQQPGQQPQEQAVAQEAPQQDFGLGGMLPPDAPLMMSPSFYNQQ